MNITPAQQSAIVDEYGELDRQLGQFKHLTIRANDLRKKIESWFAHENPEEPCVVEGKLYRVIATPRAMRRTISGMKKLFDILGAKQFLENCAFSLTNLERLGVDTAGILSEDRTGPRSVNVFLRSTAAPERSVRRVTRASEKPSSAVVVEQ